ncbi:ankyrin repeat family protein [Tanacetum coccineum]|uniref:Ankyrin repeat family protein n=1 Tax=Tanacetum coccineum TaxID=301880 RepID=A0ABQ4ZU37_9ASTR
MMTSIAIGKDNVYPGSFLYIKTKDSFFFTLYPKEVEEIKEKEDEVSSDVPIHTIVMPIRITFDNPIDFNDHFSKPKDLKKDLTISFDLSPTKYFTTSFLDSDSPFMRKSCSASVILNSLGNEDKVFKPGILVYHAIHDKNLVTLEENLKENISSGTLLVFKKPSFLLPPAEPPDECLKDVVLNFYQSKKTFPLNVEDVNSFAFIIWTFLPFFTYTKASPVIFSFRSENFVFDPGILTIQFDSYWKGMVECSMVLFRAVGQHIDTSKNLKSQIVCSGYRSILVYSIGASNVWCALCNVVTSAPPPVPHVKQLKDAKVKHETTIKLLNRICVEAERTYTLQYIEHLYSTPFCLAVENNHPEAIYVLATYFSRLYNSCKDGQDIYQLTVLNRSKKVYSYLLHLGHNTKIDLRISRDGDGNNILHLAGRLAPKHKLNAVCGAALQMQRQLQWFEEVKKAVGSKHTQELNSNKETPMMVFIREHETLRKDGEEWMKKTAKSYSIIATLIILAIVFAAAITVPGGGNSTSGKPTFEKKAGLNIFAISVGIPLFTSIISLCSFLMTYNGCIKPLGLGHIITWALWLNLSITGHGKAQSRVYCS